MLSISGSTHIPLSFASYTTKYVNLGSSAFAHAVLYNCINICITTAAAAAAAAKLFGPTPKHTHACARILSKVTSCHTKTENSAIPAACTQEISFI
jgi:hypothetical protein